MFLSTIGLKSHLESVNINYQERFHFFRQPLLTNDFVNGIITDVAECVPLAQLDRATAF